METAMGVQQQIASERAFLFKISDCVAADAAE